ncbi:hypothetical protein O181_011281 [Austropuccinia psidii MF-1]|uniref:Uncharacterized protein n=1 Tax=Austropuccinia psidii MF-1 TaxID=1389203 RepID=A0A9Q3GL69_9BASI|nr:hypothetical protein [Austropuccinia psidii MF-1]
MDLYLEIQVINPKDKNISSEERHKWRIPELPQVPEGKSRNIPVSVQGMVYGGKKAGMETSSKPLDREKELLSSSEEVNWPRKYRGPSEGLDTHVLQRPSPEDKSFFKKQKHFFRRPEEGQQPCRSS